MINQIHHGDCLEIMKDIPDKSIDMILCDLPYGVTARNKWDAVIPFFELWAQYNRVIKTNGAIVLFGQGMFTAELMKSNKKAWRYNLIWEKSHSVGFLNVRRMPLRKHEDILVFYNKPPLYNPQLENKPLKNIRPLNSKNRATNNYGEFGEGDFRTIPADQTYPKSVLKFPNESKITTTHPTQKPVSLCEYLIKTYTNEGETVLDNCIGSGTTAIAAINTNRNFVGIEQDAGYVEIARNRISEALQPV